MTTALIDRTATPTVADTDAAPIGRIADAIGSALAPRCVILFGSRARGDHRADSDLDLAVIVAQTELDAQQRHDLREQARLAAGEGFRHIDVIVWTESEYRAKKRSINHVAGRAWREGRILYGRHETLPGGGDSVGTGQCKRVDAYVPKTNTRHQ